VLTRGIARFPFWLLVQAVYLIDRPSHQSAKALSYTHTRTADAVQDATDMGGRSAELLAETFEVQIGKAR
jgi:hypothetical protein